VILIPPYFRERSIQRISFKRRKRMVGKKLRSHFVKISF